jgi:hypothetical protein
LEFEFPKLANPELSEFGTKPTNNFGGEAVKKVLTIRDFLGPQASKIGGFALLKNGLSDLSA